MHASAGSPSLTRVAQTASRLRRHDERGMPVRVSNQRISDWRRGTNVPAKFSALAVVLEVLIRLAQVSEPTPGLSGLYDLSRWREVWDAALNSTPATPLATAEPEKPPIAEGIASPCPYLGAEAFTAADSAWFHGRDHAVRVLMNALRQSSEMGSPVMLSGASGVGKTSLLGAGLESAVAHGALTGTGRRNWSIARFCPVSDPLVELTEILPELADALSFPPESSEFRKALHRSAESAVARISGEGGGLVLVVDQAELLFSRNVDERNRNQAFRILSGCASIRSLLVLVCTRTESDEACREALETAGAASARHIVLDAMNPHELRDVITEPAKAAGLVLETGLPEVILGDLGVAGSVSPDSSTLALLARVLPGIWRFRHDDMLTAAGYRAAGGINAAVVSADGAAWPLLSDADRATARSLLLRLIRVDLATGQIRRSVADLADLRASRDDGEAVARVLGVLAEARLITLEAGSARIAHEALLHAWPRLKAWIDNDRAELLVRQRLEDDAADWLANDRDPALLYRGYRLEVNRSLTGRGITVSGAAQEFLDGSIRHEDGLVRTRRHITILLSSLAVLTLLIVYLLRSWPGRFG